MKVTKTANDVSRLEFCKRVANEGCQRCPCCGETKSMLYYMSKGVHNKGILDGITKTYSTGFIFSKDMKIDCYSCCTCGAEWESEPYEY